MQDFQRAEGNNCPAGIVYQQLLKAKQTNNNVFFFLQTKIQKVGNWQSSRGERLGCVRQEGMRVLGKARSRGPRGAENRAQRPAFCSAQTAEGH